ARGEKEAPGWLALEIALGRAFMAPQPFDSTRPASTPPLPGPFLIARLAGSQSSGGSGPAHMIVAPGRAAGVRVSLAPSASLARCGGSGPAHIMVSFRFMFDSVS